MNVQNVQNPETIGSIVGLITTINGQAPTVSELADTISNNLLSVDMRVGRIRGKVIFPPGMQKKAFFGKKKVIKSDSENSTRLETGGILFLREDEEELQRLESALRYRYYNACLYGTFMTAPNLVNLKTIFDDTKVKYFEKRDDVLARWDDLVADFHQYVDDFLADLRLTKKERTNFKAAILKGVPTKQQYANSFYMNLHVEAFVPCQNGDFGDDISNLLGESWEDKVLEQTLGTIDSQAQKAFDLACNLCTSFKKSGVFSVKKRNLAQRTGQELKGNNIFSNPILEKAATALSSITMAMPEDDVEEIAEEVLFDIWRYSADTSLPIDSKKSPFTEDELNLYSGVGGVKGSPAA